MTHCSSPYFSKRQFITLSMSCLGSFALPIPAASEPSTLVIIASVRAAFNIASALGAFGSTTNGDALRMEALNIQSQQIMRNQETIMEALGILHQELRNIRDVLGEEFRIDRFYSLFDGVDFLYSELRAQVRDIDRNRLLLDSPERYGRFTEARVHLRAAIIQYGNRINEFSSPDESDLDILTRSIMASQAALKINESLKLFAWLEYSFNPSIPRSVWSPVEEINELKDRFLSSNNALLNSVLTPSITHFRQEVADAEHLFSESFFLPVFEAFIGDPPTLTGTINADLSRVNSSYDIVVSSNSLRGGGSSAPCAPWVMDLSLRRIKFTAVTAQLSITDRSARTADSIIGLSIETIRRATGVSTMTIECEMGVPIGTRASETIAPADIEIGSIGRFHMPVLAGETFEGNLQRELTAFGRYIQAHAFVGSRLLSYFHLAESASVINGQIARFDEIVLPALAARLEL